jgi:hypothetical protein
MYLLFIAFHQISDQLPWFSQDLQTTCFFSSPNGFISLYTISNGKNRNGERGREEENKLLPSLCKFKALIFVAFLRI